jgi:hypothetical protein
MIYLAIFGLLGVAGLDKAGALNLPYVDVDSCTSECCRYGTWTARKDVAVRAWHDPRSAVLAHVRGRQSVVALDGVVVTTRPGVTRVIRAVKLGFQRGGLSPLLSLQPGEELMTLHPMGEAYDRFWYRGAVYADQIDLPEGTFGNAPPIGELEIVSRPVYVWWVHIRTQQGLVGWVPNIDSFDGTDACE